LASTAPGGVRQSTIQTMPGTGAWATTTAMLSATTLARITGFLCVAFGIFETI